MYSCCYENKTFLDCLMQREEKKTEDGENIFFKALAKIFFANIKKLFMDDLLSNELHEKVICFVIMLYY